MKYLVIEIQKFSDGTVAVPPIASYDSFFDALSKYHTVLATAAIFAGSCAYMRGTKRGRSGDRDGFLQ